MDLRATTAALWLLAALLGLKALPEREGPAPTRCPDEARQRVEGGSARRELPLLLCPEDFGGRDVAPPRGAAGLLLGRPVDLNEATLEELQALPGIGPGLAHRIVDDRRLRGPFGSLEELVRVKGFGPARIGALEGLATASPQR